MVAAGVAYDGQGVLSVNFDHAEILGDLFILPSQISRNQDQWCGERRLMAAVLIDAIHCLRSWNPSMLRADNHPTREQLEWIEARKWIRSHDDGYVFSFSNICRVLGLDPKRTREMLLCKQDVEVMMNE